MKKQIDLPEETIQLLEKEAKLEMRTIKLHIEYLLIKHSIKFKKLS